MGLRRVIRRFRSAITGRFTSKAYADAHKRTTVAETDDGDTIHRGQD
jgi:hypothetical protein